MSYLKNNLKNKLNKFSESKPSAVYIFGSSPDNSLVSKCFNIHSLSRRIKQQIEILKKTANTLNLSSISANQIYQIDSIFIINKHADLPNAGPEGQNWFLEGKDLSDYKAYINPVITHIKKEVERDYELCASYPFLKVWTWRFKEIKVNYYNEKFEETTEVLKNFKGRVFQHEYDHIQGVDLLDWRVCQGEIEIRSDASKEYLNFQKALMRYHKVVAEIKKSFPETLNYYKNEINFKVLEEEENGVKWYKYDEKAFRNQPPWSKEPEIMKALQQSAEIDFNLIYVIIFKVLKVGLGGGGGAGYRVKFLHILF